jgi:hypothetical protein
MLLPFYAEEAESDPEVVHIREDAKVADPSIEVVVRRSQKEQYKHRRILGVNLPANGPATGSHRPTVVPYSWR